MMPKKMTRTNMKAAVKEDQLSFEQALKRLEDIVSQLEGAEAPLEQALALYEEGVGLARFCSRQLKAAERKVELLEDKNNELRGRSFLHEPEKNNKNTMRTELAEEGEDEEEEIEEFEEEYEEDGSGVAKEEINDQDEEQERLF